MILSPHFQCLYWDLILLLLSLLLLSCFEFNTPTFWMTRWPTFNFSLLVMTLLNFKTLPMDSVEIKQNHQQVKKVLIVKQTLTRSTMANVQCIEYACEHFRSKRVNKNFFLWSQVRLWCLLSLLRRRKRRSSMKGVFCVQHKNNKGAIYPYEW